MTDAEADTLLAPAVPATPGVWADLGAGDGLVTRALARRLGAGTVVAVDRDSRLDTEVDGATIHARTGDVRDLDSLDGFPDVLDGALCANVLHYVETPGAVLAALARRLRPEGRVVVIEYDRRRGNPWVPFPIPLDALGPLADGAGLAPPEVVGRRPSRFGGDLYVAVLCAAHEPPDEIRGQLECGADQRRSRMEGPKAAASSSEVDDRHLNDQRDQTPGPDTA